MTHAFRGFAIVGLLAALTFPAQAGPLSDVILAPGAFGVTDGAPVRYRHDRATPEGPAREGHLVVTPMAQGGEDMLILTQQGGGADMPVATFPARGGSPVLLFFLENVTRQMAALTGGSPFYIRNRIREALVVADLGTPGARLVAGQRVAVTEAVIRPFAQDPNAARMGPHAGLTLRFVVALDRPEQLVALIADTGPTGATGTTAPGGGGYTETLILEE